MSLALLAVVWYVTFERIGRERDDTVRAAARANDNLVLALEEQATRALKSAEQMLMFMKRELDEDRQIVTLSQLTREGVIEDHVFAAAFVTDRAGRILQSGTEVRGTGASIDDRAFFRHHRDHPDAGVRIGEPVVGRVTGRPVIPVTLRRVAADGSFAGVFVVGLDAAYFTSSFQRFDIGRDGVIQLVGRDGISRARRAGDRFSFGEDRSASSLMQAAKRASAGHLVTAGLEGREPRFQSYRTMADYPLVLAVGTSVRETLAGFRQRERVYYLSASVATLLLAGFAIALIVATRRRQRALRELKASEELHRTTFERSAVGIAHHSLDGRFIAANPSYCRMLGYSERELLQHSFLDLLHPDDRATALASKGEFAAASDADQPLQVENRHIRKDGTTICCAVSVTLARGPRGDQYLIALVQDISERKKAEAQLLEQLDELRRFQKVTVDRELRMLEMEEQLREMRGRLAA